MGRIKKDHGGYRSSGLWSKFQQPNINEEPKRKNKKKNTTKWCKGKVGTEHELYRYFYTIYMRNEWVKTDLMRSRCKVCRKEFHTKDTSIPLYIEVENLTEKSVPIQVKVNGVALPIDYRLFQGGHYCNACQMWEKDY